MSVGIEERLRHMAGVQPNHTVDVYPGDVLEVIDDLLRQRDLLAAGIDTLAVQAVRMTAGWVSIPEVEWDQIMEKMPGFTPKETWQENPEN